nr:serine hydrolase [Chroococcidiopsis sp. CCMEE 29]
MVQQSPTRSKVPEKVSAPQSGQNKAGRSEGLSRVQQKVESQNQARMQTTQHSSLTPEAAQVLREAVLSSQMKRSRPRAVELPPRLNLRNQAATNSQYHPHQVKEMEEASYSKSMNATLASTPKKHSWQGQRKQRKGSLVLYALRLLILGVGISAIAGTLLSVLDPTTRIISEEVQTATVQATQQEQASDAIVPGSALKLSQEIMPLKTVVQQLAAKHPKLLPGVFFVDLDTGAYLDLNGDSTFAAASMIKVPILVAFFQDVDAGKIRLDEKLTLKKELIGGGSGDMQYKSPGTQFTALETATKMITISDNTATNLLIERLGGAAALNQRFQKWGLTVTEIRNLLPDLSGTNTTSPEDLGHLMALVNQGDLVSLKSRDRLLDIMRRTVTATLLPRGLGEGATIAHKTGDIGSLVGDVGLVDMPSGKRYIAVAMVKRPHNNSEAKELIRQISKAAYQQFSSLTVNEAMPTKPFITTTPVQGVGQQSR